MKRFLVRRDSTPRAYNELCKFLVSLPGGRSTLLEHGELRFADCWCSSGDIPYFQLTCIYYDNTKQDAMITKFIEPLYTELEKIHKGEIYD